MLTYTYDLFSQRKDILSAWQKKYRYILIDEFQDINLIQWKIMCMLAAPENNLFVVGDDDQSIYRFRGSKPEIMLGFQKIYPQAKIVNLEVNYRCEPPIVEAAMRLIAHNEERFPKRSVPENPGNRRCVFSTLRTAIKRMHFGRRYPADCAKWGSAFGNRSTVSDKHAAACPDGIYGFCQSGISDERPDSGYL